jgi:hypothetical protein
MINVQDGSIILDNKYRLSPQYTFSEFINTKLYKKHHNEDRMINLEGRYSIGNRYYFVSLLFQLGKLKVVQMMVDDESINEQTEEKRKKIHDQLLEGNNIKNKYIWGSVISDYDKRSNSSDIIITYD